MGRSHGAIVTGLDLSPTCCGWDLSSAVTAGPRMLHFHFVSERLRSLKMRLAQNGFVADLAYKWKED